MEQLSQKQCVPCRGGIPPLAGEELERLHGELDHDWKVVDDHHLKKAFSFRNFAEALAFVNRVGAMAEEQGHHPDLYLTWGLVEVKIWTHAIDGLTESDFIFAAKAEKLYQPGTK